MEGTEVRKGSGGRKEWKEWKGGIGVRVEKEGGGREEGG